MKINKDDLWVYVNFVCNTLIAATNNCDKFYSENESTINRVAAFLRSKFTFEIKTIYRGLLLDENWSGKTIIPPHEKMTFVSFSENKNIALEFANPQSEYALGFLLIKKNVNGYLIEYTPEIDEILFHHSWIEVLKLDKLFLHKFSTTGEILKQKEVLLKQNKAFPMKQITFS